MFFELNIYKKKENLDDRKRIVHNYLSVKC